MRISSKYVVSPIRTEKFREPSLSLSSSLTRRLRSNGSIKGGQSSPMFSITNKKKNCNFDTSEPSSPKVTCIGQVRVKTKKKQRKKMRIGSKRSGEMGLKEEKQQGFLINRIQRWAHIHLAISEGLRALSAEFNCFSPCGGRSLCSSSAGVERENSEKKVMSSDTRGSCGEVFAKWLMVMQESEEEKREIDEKKEGEEAEEHVCVSIESIPPIPPRNALLMMRCRSDPFRMSSLGNRFWDSPVLREEEEEDEEEEEEEEEEQLKVDDKLEGVSDSEEHEKLLKEDEQKGEERLESGFPAKTVEEKQDETQLQERENEEETTAPSSSSTMSSATNPLEGGEQSTKGVLPDCLLLMMCEPKLSMEVSKETWVCRTDFLTWRRPQKNDVVSGGEGSYPAHPRPSTPAHPTSMAALIEQKLVNAAAYEPLVLTRCKSEPMRSSSKLLAPPPPEICFWKSRKLHELGVGAARIRY